MAMSIEKLLEAVKNTVITEEKVEALNERLAKAEKKFMQERRERETFPAGFLDKEFTL